MLVNCIYVGEENKIRKRALSYLCATTGPRNFHSLSCRSIQFRWYQGFYLAGMTPPTWALDNVYIGPPCQDMCSSHGTCMKGTYCKCDNGYSGPNCSVADVPNPDFLKADFEGIEEYTFVQTVMHCSSETLSSVIVLIAGKLVKHHV